MTRKVILTCAVVGENQYNQAHPNFPITPQQIADAALEAEQAGASCVHLHVRNPETGAGSRDPDLFLDMATRVRENGVKAVMNITCGGGGHLLLLIRTMKVELDPVQIWPPQKSALSILKCVSLKSAHWMSALKTN